MPQRTKSKLWLPKRRNAANVAEPSCLDGSTAGGGDVELGAAELPVAKAERFTAADRRSLFAHLAWFTDYKPILDVEAASVGASMAQLEEQYTSTRTAHACARRRLTWRALRTCSTCPSPSQ